LTKVLNGVDLTQIENKRRTIMMKKTMAMVAVALTGMISPGAFSNTLDLNEDQTVIRTGTAGAVELENGNVHSGAVGIDYKTGEIYIQTGNDNTSVFDEEGDRQKVGQFATVDTIGTEVTDALDERLTVVENKESVVVNR
jgi:hypothetical protein